MASRSSPSRVRLTIRTPTARCSSGATAFWRGAVPVVVREHYVKAITGLIDRYKRELGAAGIDYHLVTTDQPLEMALLAYLSTRGRAL